MNTIFITLIRTSLLACVCSIAYGESHVRVSEAVDEALEWRRSRSLLTYELPAHFKEKLSKFSDEDILRGFLLKMESYDLRERTRMRARVGSETSTLMEFNHEIVNDLSALEKELATEKDARRFYHLARLSYAFTESKNVDYIPYFYNSLFRDGLVSREEGEYTPLYADDVSKFAYVMILESLKHFKSDYTPLDKNLAISHEEEVQHLAKWLIENWPGCEKFNLSDQNTPRAIQKYSREKIPRTPRGTKTPNSDRVEETDRMTGSSWPLIGALTFLLGAVFYWAKKKTSA